MSWLFKVATGVGVAVALVALLPQVSHAQAVSDGASARAFVNQYCLACHSDRGFERGTGADFAAGARHGRSRCPRR